MDISKIRQYWNSCSDRFAHLTKTQDRIIEEGSQLLKIYEKGFLNFLYYKNTFKDIILVDYGIGNSELARYLFSIGLLKEYIGIDVAERSIIESKKNLKLYMDRCEYLLNPNNLSVIHGDVFLSLACIQHFPSIEYFDNFLHRLNLGNFPLLIIQIRYNEHTFSKADYNKGINIALGIHTNDQYISSKLTVYKLIHKSNVLLKSNYQYLIYKKV